MATEELPEMPNGPLMELHGQRKRFHVPHGLKPLLEEMTREVLRYQPEDIYAFMAQYVDAKLYKKHGNKPPGQGQKLSLNPGDMEEFLEELNITKDTADHYATKIQAAFRGHAARKSLEDHNQKLHKDHRKSWEWKRWSWEGSSILDDAQVDEMLVEMGVTKEQANKFATKIQATYRGHLVRRSLPIVGVEGLRKSLEKGENSKPPEDDETNQEQSTKLDGTRKSMADKKSIVKPQVETENTNVETQREVNLSEEETIDGENISGYETDRTDTTMGETSAFSDLEGEGYSTEEGDGENAL